MITFQNSAILEKNAPKFFKRQNLGKNEFGQGNFFNSSEAGGNGQKQKPKTCQKHLLNHINLSTK